MRDAMFQVFAVIAFSIVYSAAANTAPVVILGARVIDTAELTVLEDAVLVIEEPLIRAVGTRGNVVIPEGATVIDARGKTIMPGMFDLHVHVGFAEGLEAGPRFYNRQRIQRDANWALYFGVMHLVSLGFDRDDVFDVRNRQRAGSGSGARLYVAGSGFTPEGGWKPPLPTGSIVLDQWLNIPNTPRRAREMVREEAARGVDVIKIWIDDMGGEVVKFSPEFYGAIIDEAHRAGLKVAAHAVNLEDGKELIRRGTDALAHSVRDQAVDDAFLQLAKAKNITQMATLSSTRYTVDYAAGTASYLDEEDVKALLADDQLEALKSAEYRDQLKLKAQRRKLERELVFENIRKAADAGIQIVVGTDAGGSSGRFHGLANHLELEDLVSAGLTPLEAIQAATLNGANFLGVDHMFGSLAAGKVADFVVLTADPLADITNSRTIEAVWMNGKRIDRRALASPAP